MLKKIFYFFFNLPPPPPLSFTPFASKGGDEEPRAHFLPHPFYCLFHKWTATMMKTAMASRRSVILSLSLSSPSPQFRRDLWGIILPGIRSGQHADKEGK